MDSDLQLHQHQRQRQRHVQGSQHLQRMNSGLMRYQSAPSSYLASLVDELHNPIPRPSTETEPNFARFMSSGGGGNGGAQVVLSHNLSSIAENCSANESMQSQFEASMKPETQGFRHHQQQQQQNSGYNSAPQLIYSQNPAPAPAPALAPAPSAPDMGNSDRVVGSGAMEQLPQMKMSGAAGSGGNSNLIRHSSSPAGFFSYLNLENGYGVMGDMDPFGAGNMEASLSSSNRLKMNKMDFSSGPLVSSGRMPTISENESKSMRISEPAEASFDEISRNDHGYTTGFQVGSWDDSDVFSESFLKGFEDNDRKTFSRMGAPGNQNVESENRPHTMLSHHLSLPKSATELSAMEKLLQFPDSVPCKIRAKRGCATHPRSIAERVRRTRISERMKKLQELVPNMDKQTSTSDMLDLAVDYIKDLQRQLKTLSENRAKCTCENKHQL